VSCPLVCQVRPPPEPCLGHRAQLGGRHAPPPLPQRGPLRDPRRASGARGGRSRGTTSGRPLRRASTKRRGRKNWVWRVRHAVVGRGAGGVAVARRCGRLRRRAPRRRGGPARVGVRPRRRVRRARRRWRSGGGAQSGQRRHFWLSTFALPVAIPRTFAQSRPFPSLFD
jgi:hypothetical protein